MLLAFFQPLEFPDYFNQSISQRSATRCAINIYAETICDGQTPLEAARREASQAAMEVFNRHQQRHIFPLELLGPTEDPTEAELIERWDEFSRKVCPERFVWSLPPRPTGSHLSLGRPEQVKHQQGHPGEER